MQQASLVLAAMVANDLNSFVLQVGRSMFRAICCCEDDEGCEKFEVSEAESGVEVEPLFAREATFRIALGEVVPGLDEVLMPLIEDERRRRMIPIRDSCSWQSGVRCTYGVIKYDVGVRDGKQDARSGQGIYT